MARYTQDSIEQLRGAVDMAELVGARTDLRRVGTRLVGLCPFHEERTPSFSVDPDKRVYHCFGCGVGGDAIGFVMETEGLDFPAAVEALADRYRVELKHEHEDPRAEERRRADDRLRSLLDRAAGFYERYLWESAEAGRAREYLAGRGLREDVLRVFRVGYAPKAWDSLLVRAQRDGFSTDELQAAGLARKGRNGGLYDFFRERIMFPVTDGRGRVAGFGARAMRGDQGGKYVNTPEGGLFHKSRLLFGVSQAARAAARARRIVVTEGYTDVLALFGAGIEEAVAIMGTAATEAQLGELARRVGDDGTVYLALDADSSGQEAMLRAARIAEGRNLALRVVELPEGRDPAELVAADGPDAFLARLERAVSVLEFAVRRTLAGADTSTPEGVDRAVAAVRALVARAPDRSAVRDHLTQMAADRLDVPVEWIAAGQGAATPGGPAAGRLAPPEPAPAAPAASIPDSERVFLELCLAAGAPGKDVLAGVPEADLSTALVRRAREHLLSHFEDPLEGLAASDSELAAAVAGIAVGADRMEAPDEAVLRMSLLQLDLRRIEREVRHARQDGDLERQGELAQERQRVRVEMDAVMGQAS